jgi:hypothetical protein
MSDIINGVFSRSSQIEQKCENCGHMSAQYYQENNKQAIPASANDTGCIHNTFPCGSKAHNCNYTV